MRVPRVAAGVAVCALALAACSSGSGDEPTTGTDTTAGETSAETTGAAGEPATIEWWLPNWDEPVADQLIATFAEEHPEITVDKVVTTWDTMASQIRVALESGDVPDLITELTSRIPQYGRADQLLDITSWYDDAMPLDDFYEAAVDAASVGDVVYGVPFRWDAGSMVYNKAIFEQAGIAEAPTTWTELLEVAQTIYDATGIYAFGWPYGDPGNATVRWVNAYVTQGGTFEEGADGSIAIDAAASEKAIEMVTQGFTEGFVTPSSLEASNTDLQNLLTNGQLAFYFEGAYAVEPIQEAGIDIGTAMWPGVDGPGTVSADGFSFMVPKAAASPEAAKLFVQFLAQPENQALMTATFPARYSAAEDERFADPLFAPFLEQHGEHAFPAPAFVGWDLFIPTVHSALQSVALGDQTPAQANEAVVTQAASVLRTS